MSVVFLVLPLALLVVFAAVIAYTWAARRGQFDDLTTPAIRMLHEDGEQGPAPAPDADASPQRGKRDDGGAPQTPHDEDPAAHE
jgi:cbb3-type cytochrome oxidase maturation protein